MDGSEGGVGTKATAVKTGIPEKLLTAEFAEVTQSSQRSTDSLLPDEFLRPVGVLCVLCG
jgi:hypothetical protein